MRSYISFYLDAFRLALQAVFAHKLRAFLTLLVILGVLTSSSRSYAVPILLFALTYVLSALIDFLNYFYRGMGRSDIESSIQIWQRGTMVGAGLLALWWSTNLNVLAVATVVPVAVTFVFSVWFSRRLAARTAAGRTVDAAAPLTPLHLEFWRDVFPIGAGMLFSALYFRIDVFLIEHWRGPEAVATYNAAFRLLEGVRLLPGAVMAVMLPSLCQATDAQPLRRVSVGLTLFGCLTAAVIWPLAGVLLPLVFGNSYTNGVQAFRILMLSFPLMSLNYVLTQQLIGWHGQKTYAVVCALALVLNVSANLWLIPATGIDGAAWATVATEVVVTVGCAWGLRGRFLNLPPASEPASVAVS